MNSCSCWKENRTYLETYFEILRRMMAEMMSVKPEDSISVNFMCQMIPHHEGAIEMAQNILRFTRDRQVARLAEQIISGQEKSIADMKKAMKNCGCPKVSCGEILRYQTGFQDAAAVMMKRMNGAPETGNPDCDFLYEMIPHHEGAIQISGNAACFPLCPELKPILNSIVTSQSREIRQMKELITCMCPKCAYGRN